LSLRKLAPAIFLAPAVLMLTVYLIYPLVDSFRLSLLDWNGLGNDARFVGLDNWKKLAIRRLFWEAAWNNILLAVFSVLIQMPIAWCWRWCSTTPARARASSRSSTSCRS
jgi:carbohydrate ABC transporter membrane protein 1, CUT1 family (TC 3.A.1.1.-)